MQIIHSNPLCQNIAIWYDEFLTPGESFKENISKILENKKSGIEILPAEMIKTDSDSLREKYNNIPDSYRLIVKKIKTVSLKP